MKLTMETSALVDILAAVKDCSLDRTTIPVLRHVLLRAEDGRVSVRASSMDAECSASAAAEIDQPGLTTVNGRMLHGLVNGLPKGSTVSIEHDANLLAVKSGRARYRLQTLPADDFPAMAPFDGVAFPIDAADFRAMLLATLPSVSTEESRYYLNGVYLHASGGDLVAVSTDGHRLSKRTLPLPAGAERMPAIIVPTKTASLIAGLLKKGTVEVRVSDERIAVTTADAEIMSRLVDGTYPDYQRVIPRYNGASFVVEAAPLAAAVERAHRAGDDGKSAVSIKFAAGDGGLSISASGNGFDAAHEILDADVRDASKFVGMNASYLGTVTKVFGDVPLELHIANEITAVVFTSEAVPQQLMVVMPMRIGG